MLCIFPLPFLLFLPVAAAATAFLPRFFAGRLCISSSMSRVMSAPMEMSNGADTNSVLLGGRKKQATLRLCKISSFTTELVEMHSEEPKLHILFIPGNPGVVSFYKEFIQSVYEKLDGNASITAIGHISHTRKDWEHGRLFSLQDQINHKVDFINQELHNKEIPLILVGHSIGSHISLEIFKRLPQGVKYVIGLYPFLAMNKASITQNALVKITASQILCVTVSSVLAVIGLLPHWASEFLVRILVGGTSWTATAVEATRTHLLKYHAMRNILYMAKTEFVQLSKEPEWEFIREKQNQIALLFGTNDHWGPLSMFEEISNRVPNIGLSIEREGLSHNFSCTEAGSIWMARFVVSLIKRQISS